MANDITNVTKEILPDQKLDCVAYGCTSGTVAAGYKSIKEKINLAKPEAKVTTPITSAVKALNVLVLIKYLFLHLTQNNNESMVSYLVKKILLLILYLFDIDSDLDIEK